MIKLSFYIDKKNVKGNWSATTLSTLSQRLL